MTNYLTVSSLIQACESNDYILLRFPSGRQMGVNTKCAKLARKNHHYNPDDRTDFVSWRTCNFQEYISKKHGFIK